MMTSNPSPNSNQEADRLTAIRQQSANIVHIAASEPNSALKCLHLLSVAGGATNQAYQAVATRIITDSDAVGAYHLTLMAQFTPDLPVDAKALIELVITQGEPSQLLALLKNLPLPPVDAIKAKILASDNQSLIDEMNTYLSNNPEGYGSTLMPANGDKDRIVPLSSGEVGGLEN